MKIGVDLGGTNIRAGLINRGSIMTMKSALLSEKDNLDATLSQLIALINTIYNKNAKGIGIGVPSVVDQEKGIVYDAVNIPSWKEVHLKQILEDEFKVPVYINNDTNCFVLGEKYFGFGQQYNSFVGITLGTGIGSGIVLNNELVNGANCGAGEIGYLPYLEHDLEYYCSSNFFIKVHNTNGYQAYLDARQNKPKALKIWDEFGVHLGTALKSVVYTYDPETIILGGSISKAFPYFQEQMEHSLKDTYFPKSMEKLKIFVSEVEHISMLGAASQVGQQQDVELEPTLFNLKKG